jgi:hypothetical protein
MPARHAARVSVEEIDAWRPCEVRYVYPLEEQLSIIFSGGAWEGYRISDEAGCLLVSERDHG